MRLAPKTQFSLTRLLLIVAVAAVLLRMIIVPFSRQTEWVRLARQMDTTIRLLQPTQPDSIPPGVWNCAHDWVVTAYGNICFSPEHTDTAEMYRLRDDLNARVNGQIDLTTLKWIWVRLSETGPHGKRYVNRFGPSFRECFPPGYWSQTLNRDLLPSHFTIGK
jgi:hypothetical protein